MQDADRRRDALIQAGLALASELSLPAVLQRIVDLACEVSGARYGALGVVAADGHISEFLTHGISDERRAAIGRLPEGKGILGFLIHEAHPLRLRRIQDHPRSVGFPANHPPMTSFLGVPVAVRGRVFGNLYLTEKKGAGEFGEEDEQAVITLAAQAGIAIENARLYHDAETHRRRLEAVNEVSAAILERADATGVLRLIAARARELVDGAVAAIATDAGSGRMRITVADGHRAEALEGTEFQSDPSISREVMRTRVPLAVEDASLDPRTQQPIVALGDIGPVLFVPLAVGERVFGTIAVGNRQGGRMFSDEDLHLLQTFASQAAVALEYGRMREELQRLAIIEDRERIAKEIHDDIVQSLFAEGMALQAARAVVHDPAAIDTRLGQAVDNLDRVIRDLRNYIFGLRPGAMADVHLQRALAGLVDDFAEGSEAAIEVSVEPEAASLLASRAADVVQAAREALSNAVRHAGARGIRLALERRDGAVVLSVTDDGSGFEPDTAAGKGHGLGNLQSRADSLGGRLDVSSEQGRGTTVAITIPA